MTFWVFGESVSRPVFFTEHGGRVFMSSAEDRTDWNDRKPPPGHECMMPLILYRTGPERMVATIADISATLRANRSLDGTKVWNGDCPAFLGDLSAAEMDGLKIVPYPARKSYRLRRLAPGETSDIMVERAPVPTDVAEVAPLPEAPAPAAVAPRRSPKRHVRRTDVRGR